MIIDISLKNTVLYDGCVIEEVAGRLNCTTSVADMINIVGRNIAAFDIDPVEVELTGAMAIPAYLVVFHSIVHRTKAVYYNDGKGNKVLIAKHG
jgi:hypothetical protein